VVEAPEQLDDGSVHVDEVHDCSSPSASSAESRFHLLLSSMSADRVSHIVLSDGVDAAGTTYEGERIVLAFVGKSSVRAPLPTKMLNFYAADLSPPSESRGEAADDDDVPTAEVHVLIEEEEEEEKEEEEEEKEEEEKEKEEEKEEEKEDKKKEEEKEEKEEQKEDKEKEEEKEEKEEEEEEEEEHKEEKDEKQEEKEENKEEELEEQLDEETAVNVEQVVDYEIMEAMREVESAIQSAVETECVSEEDVIEVVDNAEKDTVKEEEKNLIGGRGEVQEDIIRVERKEVGLIEAEREAVNLIEVSSEEIIETTLQVEKGLEEKKQTEILPQATDAERVRQTIVEINRESEEIGDQRIDQQRRESSREESVSEQHFPSSVESSTRSETPEWLRQSFEDVRKASAKSSTATSLSSSSSQYDSDLQTLELKNMSSLFPSSLPHSSVSSTVHSNFPLPPPTPSLFTAHYSTVEDTDEEKLIQFTTQKLVDGILLPTPISSSPPPPTSSLSLLHLGAALPRILSALPSPPPSTPPLPSASLPFSPPSSASLPLPSPSFLHPFPASILPVSSSTTSFRTPASSSNPSSPTTHTHTRVVNEQGDLVEIFEGVVPPTLLNHLATQNASMLTSSGRKMPIVRTRANRVRVGPHLLLVTSFDLVTATYTCETHGEKVISPSTTSASSRTLSSSLRQSAATTYDGTRAFVRPEGVVFRMHRIARQRYEKR